MTTGRLPRQGASPCKVEMRLSEYLREQLAIAKRLLKPTRLVWACLCR